MFADAAEHAWLEELGGMNVYLVTSDHELVTPELNGSILEGVTRDALLTLAPDFGLTPVERRVGVAELLEGAHRQRRGGVRVRHGRGDHADRVAAEREDTYVVGQGRPGRPQRRCGRPCWTSEYGRAKDTRGWLRRVL